MDYADETPDRYWITNPDAHPIGFVLCVVCGISLDREHSIPVRKEIPGSGVGGGLCQVCATEDVHDHPMTPTYLEWLTTGDPRWWSAWCCNCKGCVQDEEPAA